MEVDRSRVAKEAEKLRDDLVAAKDRVRELMVESQQVVCERDSFRNRLIELEEENESLKNCIKSQEWISDQLSEVGISLILSKDIGGHLNLPLQQKRPDARSRGTPQSLQNLHQFHKAANNFAMKTEGVNSYAQAVCQARLIDKFLKMDQDQKRQVRATTQRLQLLEEEVNQLRAEVEKAQEEKQSLEQLILEILSFGEQCDLQFDKLQEKFQKFEKDDT